METESAGRAARFALAVEGGPPVRRDVLPYGRQSIDAADVDAVVEALRSDWLTTGPQVTLFEREFAASSGAAEAVAVSSGTAALHAAIYALDIGPGDEVVVPALTFAATANCIVYQGGRPVFADVRGGSLLLDPASAATLITERTRAIVAVDYAGQPCDYEELRGLADRHGIPVVADACHSPGGSSGGRPVGSLATLSAFSFHPVKHLTTGEGGMITTDDPDLARRMRVFRNHGITTDHRERAERGGFYYEMVDLGYNYRITDFQCALGRSQLRRLPDFVSARQRIARWYDERLAEIPGVIPLAREQGVGHAYHLYVVRFDGRRFSVNRDIIFRALRAEGIGCNVHYLPVHLHPFYRQRFGTGPGQCPVAEAAYEEIVSLPIFPGMTEADVDDVVEAIGKVVDAFGR